MANSKKKTNASTKKTTVNKKGPKKLSAHNIKKSSGGSGMSSLLDPSQTTSGLGSAGIGI